MLMLMWMSFFADDDYVCSSVEGLLCSRTFCQDLNNFDAIFDLTWGGPVVGGTLGASNSGHRPSLACIDLAVEHRPRAQVVLSRSSFAELLGHLHRLLDHLHRVLGRAAIREAWPLRAVAIRRAITDRSEIY